MLKSKFSNDNRRIFKAQKVFTDRTGPQKVYSDSIESFAGSSAEKPAEIIVYYGKGGIGKTALLKELKAHENDHFSKYPDKHFHSALICLDNFDYSNPVNILLAIRDSLHGDCSLFAPVLR